MAVTTDALLALRQAISSGQPITYTTADGNPAPSLSNAAHLWLSPSLSLPKSTLTRLRKPGGSSSASDPALSPQNFYALDAVYFAWLFREAAGAEYVRQAREHGLALGFVSVTERKGVVEWLEGRSIEHAGIIPLAVESTTPPGSPPPNRRFVAAASATAAGSGAGTTHAPVPGASAAAGGTKKRYVPDPTDLQVVKRIRAAEIELRDRNTVLRGSKTNNFTALSTTYAEKLRKMREPGKGGVGAVATATPATDVKPLSKRSRNAQPIIMISSSPTALITMYNVKRFLQESSFEASQDARARAVAEGNPRPEDMIPIYRSRTIIDPSGREIQMNTTYYVVDSVEALSKFGADAWERVVCVMTTGQAWQFRPYKWNDPRTLFHHVRGVYVSWSNDPPNTKISDWNVANLKIHPNHRHVDKSVVAEFWKILDQWMTINKPSLMQVK